MKKLENIAVCCALLSSIALSLYHVSELGFLGISAIGWAIVWSIAVNFLSISFILYIIAKEKGFLRYFWIWTFLPYFFVKLIYDISAYGQIFIISGKWWNHIHFFMIDLMLIGLVFYVIKSIREKDN